MKLYGALVDQQLQARALATKASKHRKRLDLFSAVVALMAPWSLFVLVFGTVSFYAHYAAPLLTSLTAAVVCIACVASAAGALKAWAVGSDTRFFRLYISVALAVASFMGWVLGDINFWQFMQPSYHIDHLATYTNVDPSSQHLWSGEQVRAQGGRYQDAGKVYFTSEAVVDRSKAMSFKDGNLYCVAPIVNPNCKNDCGYDFWAVGINCCGDLAADFRCGAYNSSRARSGLRQVVETWRPFFRLAVVQAEGIHGLESRHPLFFHWVEDPVAELTSWKLMGYRAFIVTMILSFCINAMIMFPSLKAARTAENVH
eukprot:SRR837773.8293.p1 GENE.SRR837773.8293~~SRR837773.8293.p1  ORF type:complete len:331 (-),score=113.65 SRR837773.8293:3-944(-)